MSTTSIVEDGGSERAAIVAAVRALVAWTGAALLAGARARDRARVDRACARTRRTRASCASHSCSVRARRSSIVPTALAGALQGALAASLATLALYVGIAPTAMRSARAACRARPRRARAPRRRCRDVHRCSVRRSASSAAASPERAVRRASLALLLALAASGHARADDEPAAHREVTTNSADPRTQLTDQVAAEADDARQDARDRRRQARRGRRDRGCAACAPRIASCTHRSRPTPSLAIAWPPHAAAPPRACCSSATASERTLLADEAAAPARRRGSHDRGRREGPRRSRCPSSSSARRRARSRGTSAPTSTSAPRRLLSRRGLDFEVDDRRGRRSHPPTASFATPARSAASITASFSITATTSRWSRSSASSRSRSARTSRVAITSGARSATACTSRCA